MILERIETGCRYMFSAYNALYYIIVKYVFDSTTLGSQYNARKYEHRGSRDPRNPSKRIKNYDYVLIEVY